MKRLLLTSISLLLLAGCDNGRRRGGGTVRVVCANGDMRACTCPDGTSSTMVCSNGTFGACMGCSTVNPDGGTPDTGGPVPDTGMPQPDSGVQPDTGNPMTCTDDTQCNPPNTICDTGDSTCVAGCATAGCVGNTTCDFQTGRCVGQPNSPCDIFNDQCPTGEVCTSDPAISPNPVCRPSGAATLDSPCSVNGNNCAEGQGTCVDFGFGARCYRGCGGMNNCPDMGDICWLQDANGTWGICDDFTMCDILNPNCAIGRTCTIIGDGTQAACLAAGTAGRNQPCSVPDNNCQNQSNNGCVDVGNGSLCYQICDPFDPNAVCDTGTCTELTGLNWGVCF